MNSKQCPARAAPPLLCVPPQAISLFRFSSIVNRKQNGTNITLAGAPPVLGRPSPGNSFELCRSVSAWIGRIYTLLCNSFAPGSRHPSQIISVYTAHTVSLLSISAPADARVPETYPLRDNGNAARQGGRESTLIFSFLPLCAPLAHSAASLVI